MKTNQYYFFHDSGHGWLRVSMREIINLGIADKISSYSYMRQAFAYLEEDSDFGMFLDAKNAQNVNQLYRNSADIIDRYEDGQSRIRDFDHYNYVVYLENLPIMRKNAKRKAVNAFKRAKNQLLAFELSDQETELRCAIRDNLPESYITEVKQKIQSLKSLCQF